MFVAMLILWIVSAPLSYVILRADQFDSSGRWTQADRLFWLSVSVLYGPIMLLVMGLMGVLSQLSNSQWGQRDARW